MQQNVQTQGIIADLTADNGDAVTKTTGNFAIIEDGAYSATIEHISDSDFTKIQLGNTVEVQGTLAAVFGNDDPTIPGRMMIDAQSVSVSQGSAVSVSDLYSQTQQLIQNADISAAIANAPKTTSLDECDSVQNNIYNSACGIMIGNSYNGRGCLLPASVSSLIDQATTNLLTKCLEIFPQ